MSIKIVGWGKHYENYRTRELRKIAWIPIPNHFDSDGYTELLSHPNGAAHLGAWCALLQVASRCHLGTIPHDPTGKYRDSAKYDPSENPFGRGVLVRENGSDHDVSSLTRMTRIPENVWNEALPRLLYIGWISDYDIGTETLPMPHRDTTDVVPTNYPMKGKERKGKEEEKTSAPTRNTESVPQIVFDFTSELWKNISDDLVAKWQDAYPAADVERELLKAGEWLIANPAKRKKNYRRFLVNWLARVQERGKG